MSDANARRTSQDMGDQTNRSQVTIQNETLDFVVPDHMVNTIWDAAEPNPHMQELVLNWIEAESGRCGRDLLSWDEDQNRFEPCELKWISDIMINHLVFAKNLGLPDERAIAILLDIFWRVLDLFSETSDVETALKERYQKLQDGIRSMFQEGIMNKAQAAKTLEHSRLTIFGHL